MSNKVINALLMKNEDIGVEVEMGRISRGTACGITSKYFHDKYDVPERVVHEGSHLDNWWCYGKPDHNGNPRKWNFVSDGSASGVYGSITCEMVTPILLYDDIEDLQAIIRLLRHAGAKSGAHYNAGVHIHIGAKFDREGGCNAKSIRNLVNLIASHEPLICQAVAVTPSRQSDWARFVEPEFLRKINKNHPKTKADLERAWYGFNGSHPHYDRSRYHLLNLHAIWDKGTIEFRCFEFHDNLHAGELKAWIQLCMAMVSYSKIIAYASPKPLDYSENPKFFMNSWLKNMGLMGDEFKTCRKMLMKHLSGDPACKSPRPRVADGDMDDYDIDLLTNE